MSVYVPYMARTGSSDDPDAPTPATVVDPAATPLQTWRSAAREGSPYRSFRSDLPTTYSASDHGLDSYSGSENSGATLQDQVEPDQEYVIDTPGQDSETEFAARASRELRMCRGDCADRRCLSNPILTPSRTRMAGRE